MNPQISTIVDNKSDVNDRLQVAVLIIRQLVAERQHSEKEQRSEKDLIKRLGYEICIGCQKYQNFEPSGGDMCKYCNRCRYCQKIYCKPCQNDLSTKKIKYCSGCPKNKYVYTYYHCDRCRVKLPDFRW